MRAGDGVVLDGIVASREIGLSPVLGGVSADADAVVGMAGGAAAVVVSDGVAPDFATIGGADKLDAFAIVVEDIACFHATEGRVIHADAGQFDGGRPIGQAVIAGDKIGGELVF